jgi:hypothetical protein
MAVFHVKHPEIVPGAALSVPIASVQPADRAGSTLDVWLVTCGSVVRRFA